MSMWSQLRSYVSWPTEALLPGPDPSSARKWAAWLGSFALGLLLGGASFRSVGQAIFTLGNRANPFEVTAVLAAASFLPLVLFGLLLPRVAGPLIVLASLVTVVCALPATHFQIAALVAAVLLALPMCAVGFGFIWSGLRPEPSGGVA
jgi:hypothetical protein